MEKIRVGVLGTGIIIRDYHLLTLQNHPKAEVVAAGNLHPQSLERLVQDWGIPKAYTDFQAMAEDPTIDAVVIGLPNYLHAQKTVQMLEAGKHVLCEKPMAMTVAEAEWMAEVAGRTGRKLMIAHMWRFDREIVWLRDLVAGGALGRVFKAKSHAVWLHDGPPPESWFVRAEYAGGGALADMGIHSIDTLRYVLGGARPIRVSAWVGTFFQEIELEDTATVVVEFEGGVVGIIEAGWNHLYADGLEGYSQVYGTRGYARAMPSEWRTHVEGVWSVVRPNMPPRKQQCDLPMYQAQMDHFLDSILNDYEPAPGAMEGIWAMRVLEAAYRSAETGKGITL